MSRTVPPPACEVELGRFGARGHRAAARAAWPEGGEEDRALPARPSRASRAPPLLTGDPCPRDPGRDRRGRDTSRALRSICGRTPRRDSGASRRRLVGPADRAQPRHGRSRRRIRPASGEKFPRARSRRSCSTASAGPTSRPAEPSSSTTSCRASSSSGQPEPPPVAACPRLSGGNSFIVSRRSAEGRARGARRNDDPHHSCSAWVGPQRTRSANTGGEDRPGQDRPLVQVRGEPAAGPGGRARGPASTAPST